jgi:hypothetical protein
MRVTRHNSFPLSPMILLSLHYVFRKQWDPWDWQVGYHLPKCHQFYFLFCIIGVGCAGRLNWDITCFLCLPLFKWQIWAKYYLDLVCYFKKNIQFMYSDHSRFWNISIPCWIRATKCQRYKISTLMYLTSRLEIRMLFENFCRKNFSICALHQWDRGTTFNHPWKIRKENS